jgi:hypothetical protein
LTVCLSPLTYPISLSQALAGIHKCSYAILFGFLKSD